MLNLARLSELIDSAQESIFRLEAQPSYNVTAADRDVARYLAGEGPDMERKQKWIDVLRARVARGVQLRHVRVLRLPPSDYDRMVCEWSYPHYIEAGQGIRIQETDNHLALRADFYVLDSSVVVGLVYGNDGGFVGAVRRDAKTNGNDRAYADELWSQAEPFTQWWTAHPEYHRQATAR